MSAQAERQGLAGPKAYLTLHIHRHAVRRILDSFARPTLGAKGHGRFEDEAVRKFAHALLFRNSGGHTAAAEPFAPDAALLRLIPRIALRLGSLWDEDQCSFFDVTLALKDLCALVHEITLRGRGEGCCRIRRSILLTPIANNQHLLGLLLVDAAFCRSGWDVLSLGSTDGMIDALRSTWFEAVGLSIACGFDADKVGDLIAALRDASLNPAIVVLIGGAYLTSHPDLAIRVGADATADEASLAVAACGRLVEARTSSTAYRQQSHRITDSLDRVPRAPFVEQGGLKAR